jgi:hypothetical protein
MFSNFSSSLSSGDLDLTIDIVVNEISDFIVHETPKFIEILNKAGIKSDEGMPDEALVDLLLANIPNNPNLSKTFAFQIADSNGVINNDEGTKQQWIDKINFIADGIKKVADAIKEKPALSKEIKADIMKQIHGKAASKKDYKRVILNPNKNKKLYWVLGTAGVVLTVVIIYNLVKNKNGNSVVVNQIKP